MAALASNAFANNSSATPHPILTQLPDAVWRANQMGSYQAAATTSGYRALDQELPNGGWPCSVLIELLLAQPGIGELRLLAPMLAALTQQRKTVILMAPPHIPFAPGLAELGIDLNYVILVQAEKPMDRIWAVEQTLKSASFGALLCWLPQARPDHLRRLQLAATGCDGLSFVFRPISAQYESSPAPLRVLCQASPSGQMSVDIIKRRGPVFGQPIVLPLLVPAPLRQAFAKRVPALVSSISPSLVSPTNSSKVLTHAVDRAALAATTSRHRSAIPA